MVTCLGLACTAGTFCDPPEHAVRRASSAPGGIKFSGELQCMLRTSARSQSRTFARPRALWQKGTLARRAPHPRRVCRRKRCGAARAAVGRAACGPRPCVGRQDQARRDRGSREPLVQQSLLWLSRREDEAVRLRFVRQPDSARTDRTRNNLGCRTASSKPATARAAFPARTAG